MSNLTRPQVHDTLHRKVLELTPADGETFRFYCCGPTVYGPAHIGNFRTFVIQDVFRRVVELSGQKTKHVRNITDLDDKTIRDSQAAGQTLVQFTKYWTDRFHEDCAKLNLLEPHVEPSAVDHIPHQIKMIEDLIEKGNAYQGADGSVYFKISSFETYGKLSHLDKREIVLGATANDSDEYEKDSLADFALWKARKDEDGDNFWESPWGPGRPGWHLECSAMSLEYLGTKFDLHSGGVDLCFPHHENEIAQSEAATGEKMCDHWFHVTHLMVNGGKMSKSEGDFYTVSDLAEKGFTAADLRYVLIGAYYRQPLNFVAKDKTGAKTFDSLKSAHQALLKIARAEKEMRVGDPPSYEQLLANPPKLGVFEPAWQALLDDLNTPEALGQVFTALKSAKGEEDWRALHFILAALGLELIEEESVDVPADILEKAQQRWDAKQSKDWAAADALRDELTAAGWQIKDAKDGFEVVPAE
ncbi:MAG: cysteinyl-tRNA synthetase [Verrucomicrobiales bacterium]|jgi:cysteinyl-tRNA synthetase